MNKEQLSQVLSKYLPDTAVPPCCQLIIDEQIHLTITPERKSLLGDYRPPRGAEGHRITINHNLNPYSFLITFIHEVAHLFVWKEYRSTVQPHGLEWKYIFRSLLTPFLEANIFPEDVSIALTEHLRNPKSSSCTDPVLFQTLRSYDEQDDENESVFLSSLAIGSVFQLEGRVFSKDAQLRKNFRCTELSTRKTYRISPSASVIWLQDRQPIVENVPTVEDKTAVPPKQKGITLEDIPLGSLFQLPNGQQFYKDKKLRKNYLCTHVNTKEKYRISPTIPIIVIQRG